jgi:shikimate kinase
VVVYLETSIASSSSARATRGTGPLLNDTDPQEAHDLMQHRAALYAEIADITVSTDGRRVQLVAEEIHHELRGARGA